MYAGTSKGSQINVLDNYKGFHGLGWPCPTSAAGRGWGMPAQQIQGSAALARTPARWQGGAEEHEAHKTPEMDAIKKKMVALREETDRAVNKANISEAARNDANERADNWEEKQRKWQKKANEKQDLLDLKTEELILADIKAEEKDKLFQLSEAQRNQAERTIILKEDEVERSEERLGNNTTDMSGISITADRADKIRKELERETMAREDQIEQLENKYKVILIHYL